MKTPQVPAMPGMSPLGKRNILAEIEAEKRNYALAVPLNDKAQDEKTVAERKWQAPKLAPAPQKQCDIGLFSDDAKQLDLIQQLKHKGE